METNQTNKIQEIVNVAVSNIRQAAEVNTIIGQPLVTMNGTTILPVCQVSFAFIAGGGEYGSAKRPLTNNGFASQFAGGSGGGATLTPIGFLIINGDIVKMINATSASNIDKFVDVAKSIFTTANKS